MWFAYLLAPAVGTLAVAVVCFSLLLAIDVRLRHLKVISGDYFAVRRDVSVVVLGSLVVTVVALTR
jgi:hypothetical protein